jgi:hypothetical protein
MNLRNRIIKAPVMKVVKTKKQDRLKHVDEIINSVVEDSRSVWYPLGKTNSIFSLWNEDSKPLEKGDEFSLWYCNNFRKQRGPIKFTNMWYLLAKTNAKFSLWDCWYNFANLNSKLNLLNIIRTWNQDMCEDGHVTREYFIEEENCLPRVMFHFYNHQYLEVINYIWFHFDNFENLLSGVMANDELKKCLIDLDYNMARVAAKFGQCLYDEHIMTDIGNRQIMGVTCVDGYEETASKIPVPLCYRAINISESIDATVLYRIGQYFKTIKHEYSFRFDTADEEHEYYHTNIKKYFKHLSPETKGFLNTVFVNFRFKNKLVYHSLP